MLRLTPDASVTSFSALNAPVAEVTIGEAFECDTFDCYAGQISSEAVLRPQIDMQHFNRATGPVRVTGVDAVSYTHLDVYKRQGQAWGMNTVRVATCAPACVIAI